MWKSKLPAPASFAQCNSSWQMHPSWLFLPFWPRQMPLLRKGPPSSFHCTRPQLQHGKGSSTKRSLRQSWCLQFDCLAEYSGHKQLEKGLSNLPWVSFRRFGCNNYIIESMSPREIQKLFEKNCNIHLKLFRNHTSTTPYQVLRTIQKHNLVETLRGSH